MWSSGDIGDGPRTRESPTHPGCPASDSASAATDVVRCRLPRVVGNASPVDVDPERPSDDQAALAIGFAPVGRARAPAPTPQHVAELDRPDKGPPWSHGRSTFGEGGLPRSPSRAVWSQPMSWMCQTSRVQPQPARAVDVAAATFSERVGDRRARGINFVEARVLPISSRVPQAHASPGAAVAETQSQRSALRMASSNTRYARLGVQDLRRLAGPANGPVFEVSPSYLNQMIDPAADRGRAAAHHRSVRGGRDVLCLRTTPPAGCPNSGRPGPRSSRHRPMKWPVSASSRGFAACAVVNLHRLPRSWPPRPRSDSFSICG